MKLKGLGNKTYNMLFHTHTVAGIVISFALFVIFFAGAFSLFRHEIIQWENPEVRQAINSDYNYEKALAKLDSVYTIDWHDNASLIFPNEKNPFFKVNAYQKTQDSSFHRIFTYIVPDTYRVQDLSHSHTTVGDTIYYLHYFQQIPVVGLYLSGLVSLFFFFAIVNGLLIHWRNLFTKFFAFFTEGKWRNIWTNAHTVLGVLGLPFQLIYAITGAFFGLLTLILIPTVFLLYNGEVDKVYNKVSPEDSIVVDENAADYEHLSINELFKQVHEAYPQHQIRYADMRNYGKEDAVITFKIDDFRGLLSSGSLTMYMRNGKLLPDYSILPNTKSYSESIISVMGKLHFADFGGMTMKVIYFILSLITCFMIISGVLIWRTARDNKKYSYKQRLFHHRITMIYLAICLSMFPAFAVIFLVNKLVPIEMVDRAGLVNTIFFLSWLILILIGLFWKSYSMLNRNYLVIGGVLSLLVPVANGVVTGDWLWSTWRTLPYVAYVDLFWLIIGVLTLCISLKVLIVKTDSDKPIH
ncbi:PepSY-associated TM helix domain-containing protein [Aquimarina muelleri]|uniref:PepSY-associated TM helix domain-containing protein n=1 Tax=Aquimarina muelleri TaxID=279356 RepID=UPI003F6827B7